MPHAISADIIVLLHFGFIVFVVFGGFLVLKWRWLIWLHLPAVVWGALIEFTGWICPLTPLENMLRMASGSEGYAGSFIGHYITRIVYPSGLNRGHQIALGFLVLLLNTAIYVVVLLRPPYHHDKD